MRLAILGLALALVPGRFLETSQSAWVKLIATFFTGIFIIVGLGLFLYGTAIVIDALAVLNTSLVATLGLTVGATAFPLWGVIALGAVASVVVVAIIVGIVTGVKNYRASTLRNNNTDEQSEAISIKPSKIAQDILNRSSMDESYSKAAETDLIKEDNRQYDIYSDDYGDVDTDISYADSDIEEDVLDTDSNLDLDPVNKKELSEEEQYLYNGEGDEDENEEDDKSDTAFKPT